MAKIQLTLPLAFSLHASVPQLFETEGVIVDGALVIPCAGFPKLHGLIRNGCKNIDSNVEIWINGEKFDPETHKQLNHNDTLKVIPIFSG